MFERFLYNILNEESYNNNRWLSRLLVNVENEPIKPSKQEPQQTTPDKEYENALDQYALDSKGKLSASVKELLQSFTADISIIPIANIYQEHIHNNFVVTYICDNEELTRELCIEVDNKTYYKPCKELNICLTQQGLEAIKDGEDLPNFNVKIIDQTNQTTQEVYIVMPKTIKQKDQTLY